MKNSYLFFICLLFTGCLSDRGAYLYSKEDTLYKAYPNIHQKPKARDGTILHSKKHLKWYENLSETEKQKYHLSNCEIYSNGRVCFGYKNFDEIKEINPSAPVPLEQIKRSN